MRWCRGSEKLVRVLRGNDNDRPELSEVVVEGEGCLNCEALHDDSAHAVGEAPIFVGEIAEGIPGGFGVGLRDPFQLGNAFRHEPLTYA